MHVVLTSTDIYISKIYIACGFSNSQSMVVLELVNKYCSGCMVVRKDKQFSKMIKRHITLLC